MKVLSWILALLGLWEFGDILALVTPGFGTIRAFVWNHIFVGLVLVIAGAWAARARDARTAKTLHWIAAGAGAWLVIAPFLFGPPAIAAGRWNDIIVGALAFILGAWAALATPRAAV